MTEPLFTAEAQARDHQSGVELKRWANHQMEAAVAKGCKFLRSTSDLGSIGHVILEGWATKPKDELPAPNWADPERVTHSSSTAHNV